MDWETFDASTADACFVKPAHAPIRRMFTRLLLPLLVATSAFAAEKPRPLLRDFIGLNGHTISFRPDLYAPVTSRVRDYHPIDWDFGKDTSYATKFPMARNGVDWSKVYGSWKKAGHRIETSLIFDNFPAGDWKDLARDARAYGEAYAKAFAGTVEAAEIGNEPGKYDDATYRTLFENMATGLRAGDSRMKVATCAANLGKSGAYSKSVDVLSGLESLYDIINIHQYAEMTGWPTWERSYPEDPRTHFLENIGHVLKWREEHVPEKEVWLTEFGYDATTKPNLTSGDFVKWIGNTETQQAQWLVRSFLVLANTTLDRAYIFYFNDEDTPHLHASSGLTRNFVPKPAFHAVAHLQKTLGNFRFAQARQNGPETYVYEFANDAGEKILAVWKTQDPAAEVKLDVPAGSVKHAERMPLQAGPAEEVAVGPDTVAITAGAAPTFVWLFPPH